MNTDPAQYKSAHPFPHVVLDNYFDAKTLNNVLSEWPNMDAARKFNSYRERKAITDSKLIGQLDHTHTFIEYLNSDEFISKIKDITGINELVADPQLIGGGLHETKAGGYLGIHTDFNLHRTSKLYRRVNVLIYLNKKWSSNWGGDLELWTTDGTQCAAKVKPIFNRTVIFNTTSNSYHGHPHPCQCPENMSRKSIAMYYYSQDPGEQSLKPHSTNFI